MPATLTRPVALARRPVAARRPGRRPVILRVAGKRFALRGDHGVPLRQVADEAGVPPALVGHCCGAQHCYGARRELFHAIFAHRQPVIDQRLALLREAMIGAGPPTLRRVHGRVSSRRLRWCCTG